MRDLDVRISLRRDLNDRFANDPYTKIIEELGVCQGSVRIDIAVANCSLHGYEIKSAADTLERLPTQADAYSKVFDYVTLVIASCHLESALQFLPSWWGIIDATEHGGQTHLTSIREAGCNPDVESYAVAQLLWREEALELLERLGYAKGMRSKPREHLWKRLAQVIPPDHLRQHVRHCLKHRASWRVAVPPA